jgi:hypothetical protein
MARILCDLPQWLLKGPLNDVDTKLLVSGKFELLQSRNTPDKGYATTDYNPLLNRRAARCHKLQALPVDRLSKYCGCGRPISSQKHYPCQSHNHLILQGLLC